MPAPMQYFIMGVLAFAVFVWLGTKVLDILDPPDKKAPRKRQRRKD